MEIESTMRNLEVKQPIIVSERVKEYERGTYHILNVGE